MSQEVLEAWINGPELLVFLGRADDAIKQDVMASALYTQLAAHKRFNKFTHHSEWHATLLNAHTSFGWLRLALERTDGPVLQSDAFSALDIFIGLLPQAFDGWRGGELEEALARLVFSLPDAGASALHARSVSKTADPASQDRACASRVSSVVLQLALVLPTAEKISMCVAFETDEPVAANPFTQRFSRHRLAGEINTTRVIEMLDNLRYRVFRQGITEALQDRREELILPIDGLES